MQVCKQVFAHFQGKTEWSFNRTMFFIFLFDMINELTINLIGQVLM